MEQILGFALALLTVTNIFAMLVMMYRPQGLFPERKRIYRL